MGRRTFTHRTFTHRTVAHRTFIHRTVAHLILHAYLILKRVLLANSTFIWYFNANRMHSCVERIVSVTNVTHRTFTKIILEMWAYRRQDGDASAILRHQRYIRVSNPGRDRIGSGLCAKYSVSIHVLRIRVQLASN